MKSAIQQKAALSIGKALEARGHWWRAARLYEANLDQAKSSCTDDLRFRAAYCRHQTKRYDLALEHLASIVDLKSTNTLWLHLNASSLAKRGSFREALNYMERCIELNPVRLDWYIQLSNFAVKAKELKLSIRYLENALIRWPENAEVCNLLAKNLYQDQGRWRELEVLQHGLKFYHDSHEWNDRLANCLFYLRRYGEAATFYAEARKLQPKNLDYWYHEGLSYELSGDSKAANNAYGNVRKLDKRLKSDKLGIGAVHQSKGNWKNAAHAYHENLKKDYYDAELHYRLGVCHEKLYNWTEAQSAYVQAIALNPEKSHWHYRLAYVLERDHKYEKASEAYVWSATSGTDNIAFRWFRAGYASAKAGKEELACHHYLNSAKFYGFLIDEQQIGNHSTNVQSNSNVFLSKFASEIDNNSSVKFSSRFFEKTGDLQLKFGEYEKAAESFKEAIFLRSGIKYALHAKHAYALMNANRFSEAVQAFSQMRQFARPTGVDERPYMKGPQTRRNLTYAEYRDTLPVEDNIFFFESSHGSSIHCNPYAMYKELRNRADFGNYKIIWVLNDLTKCPLDLLRQSNVLVVKQHSDPYLRYLATAKYLINNVTFPIYFSRRPEQKYLNTWHGTPLKLMGKLVKGAHFEHKNVARNFLHVTHFFLPNQHTFDCLVRDHDLDGLIKAKTQIAGSPRIDQTIALSDKRKSEIRTLLGILPGQRVVLYAPTWRGQMSDHVFDAQGLADDLATMARGPHKLLFRAHRFAEKAISGVELDAEIVPSEVDTNELLSIVDVLVTDYSSIFFDFLPLGREIVFYTPDYEQYSKERGLYITRDEWPGAVYESVMDVHKHIRASTSSDQKFEVSRTQQGFFAEYAVTESGHAAADAVNFLLNEDAGNEIVDEKKSILFYQGSFMPNGILTSFISLINSIDFDKYRVVVAIDSNLIKSGSEADEALRQISTKVQVIARAGTVVLSSEEHAISDQFHSRGQFNSNEQHDLFKNMMRKEFSRIFGDASFDVVIDFEGYSRFWGAIFSNPSSPLTKSIVYLHNDMSRERDTKYPRMDSMFRIYNDFSSLVSVSESVNEVNKERIGNRYGIELDKFTYANNTIDIERPYQLRDQHDSEIVLPKHFKDGRLFVNMARLSPEKGHQKLLEAFAMVASESPDSNLIIMGDGPLRSQLQRRAAQLNLENRVLFTGQVSNPFPILNQCDCFVFSSEYEGQGLAMIEAMMMGLTVISTDVVGSRSVVEDGFGILVENSTDGLLSGMRRYINGERPKREFSAQVYQNLALRQFEQLLS